MELLRARIEPSSLGADRARLVGTVAYDDRTIAPEEYWFDVPETCAESLSESGNPWLTCLIPLAVVRGEPLRLGLPVDRTLYENVQELQLVWKCWYPHLSAVPVEVEVADPRRQEPPRGKAAFFSGGVDSFFTVLRHHAGVSPRAPIEDLLLVWGFDVPLEDPEAFRRMREWLGRAADELGSRLIDVATNLRTTRWRQMDWGHFSHGCALASIAHSMGDRYGRVLIAASDDYAHLQPWGSHPLTDPLLSTSRTQIRHDGAGFTRLMKTELVARSDVAMRSLRVCWRSQSELNCCRCEKCYRTMMGLELYGAQDRGTTFRAARMDLSAIPRIHLFPELVHDYEEMRALASRSGRDDIAGAIEVALRRSRRNRRRLKVAEWLRARSSAEWLARLLERIVLAGSVR